MNPIILFSVVGGIIFYGVALAFSILSGEKFTFWGVVLEISVVATVIGLLILMAM